MIFSQETLNCGKIKLSFKCLSCPSKCFFGSTWAQLSIKTIILRPLKAIKREKERAVCEQERERLGQKERDKKKTVRLNVFCMWVSNAADVDWGRERLSKQVSGTWVDKCQCPWSRKGTAAARGRGRWGKLVFNRCQWPKTSSVPFAVGSCGSSGREHRKKIYLMYLV